MRNSLKLGLKPALLTALTTAFVVATLPLTFNGCSSGFDVDSTVKNLGSAQGNGGVVTQPSEPPLTQDIAQMKVTTVGAVPIDSKDVYVNGHVAIVPTGTAAANAFDADSKLKGRGNFTWTLAKKPYKIKLNSKAAVMGMPEDKEWVLLANHVDKTLVRTTLAYELSRRLGAEYTPRGAYVDLNLNGAEIGSYFLTEQVKIAPMRVNVDSLLPTDITGDALTGGYLIELNARLDEVVNWSTSRGTPYSLKEPSEAAPEQVTYIRNYFQETEDVLNSAAFADPVNGYAKYIDVDSFVQQYLLNEILKNKDAANFSSIFFFKGRGQKLKMGPGWDFDLAAGNSDVLSINDPEGWHLRTGSPWFSRLFQDPVFEAKVRAKWNLIKTDKLDTLDIVVDRAAFQVGISQVKNFTIWNIMNVPFFGVSIVPGSYQGEVDRLKNWIKARILWIDHELNPSI